MASVVVSFSVVVLPSAGHFKRMDREQQKLSIPDKQFNLLLSKIKELRETRSYVLCLFKKFKVEKKNTGA